jgi:hypothetical protein
MRRLVLFLLGTFLLLVLLRQLGPSEILHLLGQVGWHAIPIILLYSAHVATRTLALRACVLRTPPLPFGDALAIRLAGESVESLTLTGPLLAEPTKAWLLERHGLTRMEGYAATLTEYLICTLVAAAMSIAGLLYLVWRFPLEPILFAIATGVACGTGLFLIVSVWAIVRRMHLIGAIIAGLARAGLLRGRLRPDMPWIHRLEDLLLAILHDRPARLALVILIEAAAQAFLILELVVVLHSFRLAVPLLEAFTIEASTKFSGAAFAFIPLQMGAAEGTYAVMFRALGLPTAAGFALAFVRRLRTLLIACAGLTVLTVLPVHAEAQARDARREQRGGPQE